LSKDSWMEWIVANSGHPVQRRAFEHFARREYAKVYCWWSRAFFDFGFMVKRRSSHCHRHRFCDIIVLLSPHTSYQNRILPRQSRWWFQGNRGDFEKIIPFTFLANRSSSYWLFHSSSRCLSRQEKWLRAKSFYDVYISLFASKFIYHRIVRDNHTNYFFCLYKILYIYVYYS